MVRRYAPQKYIKKHIYYKTKKTIMKQMTEQEKKEFEAEWRSGLKLFAWIIGTQVVFGLLIVVLCWILI